MKKFFILFFRIIQRVITLKRWGRICAIHDQLASAWYLGYVRGADPKAAFARGIQLIGPEYMKIGSGSSIAADSNISCLPYWSKVPPKLTIGSNCEFGYHVRIICTNSIEIGDNVLTGQFCLITDNSHGLSTKEDMKIAPKRRYVYSKGG